MEEDYFRSRIYYGVFIFWILLTVVKFRGFVFFFFNILGNFLDIKIESVYMEQHHKVQEIISFLYIMSHIYRTIPSFDYFKAIFLKFWYYRSTRNVTCAPQDCALFLCTSIFYRNGQLRWRLNFFKFCYFLCCSTSFSSPLPLTLFCLPMHLK